MQKIGRKMIIQVSEMIESADQLIEYETNHDQDDKPPVSDHGTGYDEGNDDGYEKIMVQNPSGHGSL
ncbi:hypothetical protein QYF36_017794 [Acer negundo]|nr:hypothetical protein QYF36_017794 [Acer negundo]